MKRQSLLIKKGSSKKSKNIRSDQKRLKQTKIISSVVTSKYTHTPLAEHFGIEPVPEYLVDRKSVV